MAGLEGLGSTITAVAGLLKKHTALTVAGLVSGMVLYLPDSWNPASGTITQFRWVFWVVFLFAVFGILVNVSVWLWSRTRQILSRLLLERERRKTLARLTPKEKAYLLSYVLDESLEQTREAGGVMGLLSQKGVVVCSSNWLINSMAPFALEKWARARLLKKPSFYLSGYCRATLASLRGRTGAEMDDVKGVELYVLEETRIQSQHLLKRESERQLSDGSGFERLFNKVRLFVSSRNKPTRN